MRTVCCCCCLFGGHEDEWGRLAGGAGEEEGFCWVMVSADTVPQIGSLRPLVSLPESTFGLRIGARIGCGVSGIIHGLKLGRSFGYLDGFG